MLKPKPLIPGSSATYAAPRYTLAQPHDAHTAAKKNKDKISGRYDEAMGYSTPGRDGINAGPDQGEVYDDTAMLATPEFASRIQQGVLPNFSRWCSFVAGLLVPEDERPELAESLQQIDSYLYEMIGSSNFTVEVTEAILDVALGTGAIRIDEHAGSNPFNTRAVPLRGLDFGIGPDGRPDPICETRKVSIHHIPVLWPGARLPAGFSTQDPAAEVDVVEIWQRDWSEPEEWRWRRTVFLPGTNNAAIHTEWVEGEGGNPYIVFRWMKVSGEAWGRGPLFMCLPSMRKCNFAERALLDHTDIALAGIWTMEDDGVVNTDTVRLEPGTLVPRAAGSAPLQNVAPGANFDIAAFMLENSRLSIRKALFTEQLGSTKGTPMSATEVTQRMTELARAIGSPFARLIIELAMPAIARFVRILKDRKLIKMPVVDGKQIKLISTSPLAMAQNFEDIDRIERFLASMAALYGQPALNIVSDISETSHKMAELYHVPARIVRPKEQQRAMIDQVAQSVAQGAAGGQANGEAGPASQPGPGA